jgi:hypothetical protein
VLSTPLLQPDAKKQKIDNHGTEMAASTAKVSGLGRFDLSLTVS